MENPVIRSLPSHTSLSSQALYFLNSKLSTRNDLDGGPAILSELQIQCDSLHKTLSELNEDLGSHLTRHSSHSECVGSLLHTVRDQLLSLSQSSAHSQSDGGTGKELQALAKEVARVETVRDYAETALKLDTLVGDIEDAVSSAINTTLRGLSSKKNDQDMRAVALKTLKLVEDMLSSVTKKHPEWSRLVSAVDHRIDRALAILRPQAIADHRTLLTSLGWPPPLSTLSSSTPDSKEPSGVQNPLFTMQGDLKLKYCQSFLTLCRLQELQRQRKSRQLEGHYKNLSLHQPLWTIEELVNPISIASQRHFSKWIKKPEFIFALVYKITRDYVDSMDDLLQPLADEAMLSGYSCREEWISAMVSSLSTYLAKEIFPVYVSQLDQDNDTEIFKQARISWLNLVDLMISFDKRVQSLATHSGMVLSLPEDENIQKISSLSVFCDMPDWLDLWAEIELYDVVRKLKSQLRDETNWKTENQRDSVLSSQEENKSPIISSVIIRFLSSVIDRCRALPSISLRSRFVKRTGVPIIHKFFDCLLRRCQEAEGLTALTDDAGLVKVAKSINAASDFEKILEEWSEDVFFLEMGYIQSGNDLYDSNNISTYAPEDGIFYEEIERLKGFRIEWVEKLSTVVLRGFDSHIRDYIKNKKQWLEKSEEAGALSRSFIEAMDYLQGKLSVLEEGLNKMEFTKFWRSLALGIDKLIFNSIVIGNVKFYDWGVERLWNDLEFLFGIFAAWCLWPEGFFPKVSQGMKVLKMDEKNLKNVLIEEERFLKENGIRHLSVGEIEKIAKNRVFG